MATPLADLLRSVLTDDTVRLAAGRSPSAILRDHGWEHLDAADLREAMLVLADGTPSVEATIWVAGSDAIGPDIGAGDALAAATATFSSDLVADDPHDIDHIEETDELDELDELDEIDDTRTDTDTDTDDLDPSDDAPELEMFESIDLDEIEQFADPHTTPHDDTADPGELGDAWDDLI